MEVKKGIQMNSRCGGEKIYTMSEGGREKYR